MSLMNSSTAKPTALVRYLSPGPARFNTEAESSYVGDTAAYKRVQRALRNRRVLHLSAGIAALALFLAAVTSFVAGQALSQLLPAPLFAAAPLGWVALLVATCITWAATSDDDLPARFTAPARENYLRQVWMPWLELGGLGFLSFGQVRELEAGRSVTALDETRSLELTLSIQPLEDPSSPVGRSYEAGIVLRVEEQPYVRQELVAA